MKSINAVILILIGGMGISMNSGCSQSRETKANPNIIYILADDLGYAELGCYGQEKIETPNMDKLAAGGMRFTQHYAGAPVCAGVRCEGAGSDRAGVGA